jgi:predicted secreted protein
VAPSFRAGKSGFLSITSATGGTVNLSSGLDNVQLSRSVQDLVVTTFGDNDVVRIAGLRDGSITFSGHFASTYEEKLSALLGHSTTTSWIYGPESTSNTRRKLSGAAILTDFTIGGAADGKVDMSGTLALSGTVTSTTF